MSTQEIIVTVILVVFAIAVTIATIMMKGGIKEWLKWAVTEAESYLGGGTGQLKLRYVYDLAVKQFPIIKYVLPFSVFEAWVDEALVWMRQQIDANAKIAEYVETPFATLQLSDIVSNSKEQ